MAAVPAAPEAAEGRDATAAPGAPADSNPKRSRPADPPTVLLRCVGLCGVDDACAPELESVAWPSWVEFGVLFRAEKEGRPRFPRADSVRRLAGAARRMGCALAAHLCSTRCEEVLHGKPDFVRELRELGFARVQVNATLANNVDSAALRGDVHWPNLRRVALAVPDVEFILQRNAETEPLWAAFEAERARGEAPPNVSMLFDASVGRGVTVTEFPVPASPDTVRFGYAGGIRPENVESVLRGVARALDAAPARDRLAVWIDMESGVRDSESDAFSLAKARAVVERVSALSWVEFAAPPHPR